MALKLNGNIIVDDSRQIQNLSSLHDSATWAAGTSNSPSVLTPSKLIYGIGELAGGLGYIESSGVPDTSEFVGGEIWHNLVDSGFYMFIDSSYIVSADSGKGLNWIEIETSQITTLGTFDKAVFSGGEDTTTSVSNRIDYSRISISGTVTDWGDLTQAIHATGAASDGSSAYTLGGDTNYDYGSQQSNIERISLTTAGNSVDVADLALARSAGAGASDGMSLLLMGGSTGAASPVANIDAFRPRTGADASNFASLSLARYWPGAVSNAVRAIAFAGYNGGERDTIDYVTFASGGTATNFAGVASATKQRSPGGYNSYRGVFTGHGDNGGANPSNVINYITMATSGDAMDFGDLSVARGSAGTASNGTRVITAGGFSNTNTYSNVIDYITVATTGNSTDFDDLGLARAAVSGTSGYYGG